MKKGNLKNSVSTALCIALGILLPVFFHAVGLGSAFLPMHIPVLLCGFLCGWPYGAVCGLLTPLLSSLLTGMPPIFPVAAAMMPELCAYGLLSGLLYRKHNLYFALLGAMLGGRIVSGLANLLFLGMAGKPYSFSIFLSSNFVQALPGIIVQIVLIPLLVLALQKAKLTSHPLKSGSSGSASRDR